MAEVKRKAWANRKPRHEKHGPWLLWSHYHGAWHCRSESGGAAGYTTDLTRAGFFDLKVARAYHDWREGRNEAVPVSAMRDRLEAVLAETTQQRDAFAAKLAALQSTGDDQ